MAGKNSGHPEKKPSANFPIPYILFFDKLLKNAATSFMITDDNGALVYVNPKHVEVLGFSSEEIMGKDWINQIVPKKSREEMRRVFELVKTSEDSNAFQTSVLTKGGEVKPISWISIPLKREDDFFMMFIGKEGGRPGEENETKLHELSDEERIELYDEIIDALFEALESAESDTADHCANVATYAAAIAKKMNMGEKGIERLKLAALVHDVGKLVVDEKILFKNGKLTIEEYEEMKKHAKWGAEIIYPIFFLREIIPMVVYHHENYDGSGYPYGLKGEEIPLEARILSVADIYEALTSNRPYRKAFSKENAIKIMEEEKGTKLDPVITDIFLELLEKGEVEQ